MDFERAIVLLDFIEAASKHGATYNVMVTEARNELFDMNQASKKKADDARAKAEAPVEPTETNETQPAEPVGEGLQRRLA